MDFFLDNASNEVMESYLPRREQTTLFAEPSAPVPRETEDKENDIEDRDYVAPRPARRMQPTPETKFNARTSRTANRARKSQRQKAQDFTIAEDDTAWQSEYPRRAYYGSKVPALGDISNGQYFPYTMFHRNQKISQRQLPYARMFGDQPLIDYYTEELKLDYVNMQEKVSNFYEWTIEEHPFDVLLWLKRNNYDRRWTPRQKDGFRAMLKVLRLYMMESYQARVEGSEELASEFHKMAKDYSEGAMKAHGIKDIVVFNMNYACWRFVPARENMPQLYRKDFTPAEQMEIDTIYPGYWAEGEELKDKQAEMPSSELEPESDSVESANSASQASELYEGQTAWTMTRLRESLGEELHFSDH